MSETERPLRADAARNRARVLEVAYETMAAEGLAVPIDEIARRAGVGAGTVYRHFPTKESLFGAVIQDRLQQMVTYGRDLLASSRTGRRILRLPQVDGDSGRRRPEPRPGDGGLRNRHQRRRAGRRNRSFSVCSEICWPPLSERVPPARTSPSRRRKRSSSARRRCRDTTRTSPNGSPRCFSTDCGPASAAVGNRTGSAGWSHAGARGDGPPLLALAMVEC